MAHLRWLTWTMATTRCGSPPPLLAPIVSTYSSLPGRLRWISLSLYIRWPAVRYRFWKFYLWFLNIHANHYRLLISRALFTSRSPRITPRWSPSVRPAQARPASCRFANTKIFLSLYISPTIYFWNKGAYIYLLLKLTHKCSSFSLAVLLWAEMSECMLRTQATVGRFICWKIFFWNDWFIRIKLNSHFFRIKILSSELEFIAHIDAEVRKKLAKYRRLHKI